MKSKFFSFKLTASIFIVLLAIALTYLSNEPISHSKEITKEIHLLKPNAK